MAESPTRTMRATRSRYRPALELGHGATATVWRARDTRTGRDVALKRFHPHLVADPVARERIEQEVAAASRVSHPNIVSPLEVLDDRDGLALVLPFVEGETLAKRLAEGPALAPREAAKIALDVCDGLAVAHSSGVIHRDVKPGNILLGADGRARLLDFGIARAIDELDEDHRLTGAGMAIGTMPYMAPEQLAAGPTTPAIDVYALGVVTYEMLSGRQPYAAASPVTLATEQAQPPAPIQGVPEPLMQLTLNSMTADAAARPDAAQFARGLRAWLDGRGEAEAETSLVSVPGPMPIAPRRTRHALGWLAAGAAVVVLAAAVPVAAAVWLAPAPSALDLAKAKIDHIPLAAVVLPTATPAPPQAPVIGATQPEPPARPTAGSGHHGHHHHHKRHHDGPHRR